MNDTILFVFEGEKLEGEIFKSIENIFFPPYHGKKIIRASFCGEIYQLWKRVKDDAYLDIVEILKDRPNSDIQNLNRNDVSEVHLFFDHDAHSRPSESLQEYMKKFAVCLIYLTMSRKWVNYGSTIPWRRQLSIAKEM